MLLLPRVFVDVFWRRGGVVKVVQSFSVFYQMRKPPQKIDPKLVSDAVTYHSNFLDYTSPFYFPGIHWRNRYTADYTK